MTPGAVPHGPPPGALHILRPGLVARLRADAAPVILIEGPAGTGKTCLLAELGDIGRPVIDLEPGQTLVLPDTPCLIAKRPETQVTGLARAAVFGRVSRYGTEALLFSEPELAHLPGLFANSGGWACLFPTLPAETEAFLRDEILGPLPSAALVAFEGYLADPTRPPTQPGLPFAVVGPDLPAPLRAVRAPLTRAIRALLTTRAQNREEARGIATALIRAGRVPEGIAQFQTIAAWEAALNALDLAGGPFFVHRYGPEAFDRMLAGFPPDMAQGSETLVLSLAIQAIKRGEVALMRHILTQRWGPEVADPHAVLSAPDRYSLPLRFFRLLIGTWEDTAADAALLDRAYTLLAEIPATDDLRRGSFYNAVLEFYMRERRFAEADHAAHRAAGHYARAAVPILSFYIALHRAIIRLFLGHARQARHHAQAARAHLAASPYDSPGDARLLALLDACIDYEMGQGEALARFLSLELDDLAQGEIWPSLVELTLIYGSQALGERYSGIAARSFLDRWRVTQALSSQFRRLIDIREVQVIQNAGRWAEAAQRAAALPGPVTLAFVQGAALTGLTDRDDVALALVWLRHMAQVMPKRAGLAGALRGMLDNPHLTARQRVGLDLWLAHVLRRTGDVPGAEAILRRTLGQAAEHGSLAILGEEKAFLTDLLASRRLRAALEREEPLRRLLRQMHEAGPGRTAAAEAAGLTRQEMRILHAISEGAANKAVANLLGLSEATVKFHLANLYRKLGCRTRREAVAAAGALRLVS